MIRTVDHDMIESERSDVTSDRKPARPKQAVSPNAERTRRRSFRSMLIIPVLLAIVLLVLVFIGREAMVKKEFLHGLDQLRDQIADYQAANGRLPSREYIQDLDLSARASVRSFTYDGEDLSVDSPKDSILAYSSLLEFRFLESGLAVLYLNGELAWLSAEQFDEEMTAQRQRINRRIMMTD